MSSEKILFQQQMYRDMREVAGLFRQSPGILTPWTKMSYEKIVAPRPCSLISSELKSAATTKVLHNIRIIIFLFNLYGMN